jgi:DNA-binding NarL/FixJ family response regulator
MPAGEGISDGISTSALTECQRKIVTLMAEGLTNQGIANRLGLERHTVSDHVAQILWRLGATGRIQVAIWAARHRLYPPSG